MKKVIQSVRKNNKGFTMIEIIIGIALVGIISAATVPSFLNMTLKTQLKADIQSVQTLQNMVDMYTADHDGEKPKELTAGSEIKGVYSKLQKAGYLSTEDLDSEGNLKLQTKGTSIKYNGEHMELSLGAAEEKLKAMATELGEREKKWIEEGGQAKK